jgi:hypothetical protein
VIRDALPAAMKLTNVPAWLTSAEMSRTLSLWLEPSWRIAQGQGMSDVEFARWMEAGLWNLAGDNGVQRAVDAYRAVAGPSGWILAAARISPQVALERAQAEGIEALIDSVQVMNALAGLASNLLPTERAPQAAKAEDPEPDRGPISFN